MSTIEQSVDVDVPVRTAYNQWTQFEDFPRFMEGVEEVQQLSDTRLHWIAKIAGARREWDAEITEQRPDERVAWKATAGVQNGGVVETAPGTPYEILFPYADPYLREVRFDQSADVMFLTHHLVQPWELRRLAHTNWTSGAFSFRRSAGEGTVPFPRSRWYARAAVRREGIASTVAQRRG